MDDPDVPDMSHGDYYCRVCDSHMNAASVWEAHVTGKKHNKNVKKGETESRYEEPFNAESSIKYELRNVRDPVVGLSFMHEIRKKEPDVPPTFCCFLCHATMASVPLVIEHVISSKHRLNYIKERDPDEYRLIQSTNLKKDAMEPLITDAARKLEQEYGRGTVKVKQERRKTAATSVQRPDLDDNNSFQSAKFDADSRFKNSDDIEKRRSERSRSRSRDYDDNYTSHRYRRSRSRDYEDSHRHRSRSPGDSYLNRRRSRSPGDSYLNRRRSRSPGHNYSSRRRSRSPKDKYVRHGRSRSPRDFYERKQSSYFDKERSFDKRSSSKRNHSPSPDVYERHISFTKRDTSPKHDYNHSKNDDYMRQSKKNDFSSDLNSGISRYRANTQQSIDKPYHSPDHRQSASSYLSQEKHLPLNENPVSKQSLSKTLLDFAIDGIKQLTPKDCETVLNFLMESINKVTSVQQILTLTQNAKDCQEKLRSSEYFQNYMAVILQSQRGSIPGIGDGASQINDQNNIEGLLNLVNNVNNPASKVSALPPFQPSVSHVPNVPMVNSQQPGYQAPPINFNPSTSGNYPKQAQNLGSAMNIPGLDSNITSLKQHPDIRSDFSQNAVDAENFINNIFKSANIPPNKIPGQIPYQAGGNYQATRFGNPTSSANSYQGVMGPNQKQVPYQRPNIPFPQANHNSNYSSFPPNYNPKY